MEELNYESIESRRQLLNSKLKQIKEAQESLERSALFIEEQLDRLGRTQELLNDAAQLRALSEELV